MFAERTLLERLAKPRQYALRTMSENTPELVKSILLHLQKLLNTRQGNAPAQMDFGIPDPSEVAHALPEAVATMQNAIKGCIEKYEPRLKAVQVTHVVSEDDVLTIRFQISAQAATSKDRVPICFDTLVDSSGRIKVKA